MTELSMRLPPAERRRILGTRQKFYELAMSDFVFVSQLELIAALTFLGLVLCAPGRSQVPARETYVEQLMIDRAG